MPPPSRHVDHSSSLKGLDLAVIGQEDRDLVIGREDQPCTDGTDDITTQYRQVQSAVRTTREKSKQKVKIQLEMKQGVDAMMKEVEMQKAKNEKAEKILIEQTTEMKKKMQKLQETNMSMETAMEQLQETNKNMEARIEALLTAKQPVKSGSQQKYPRVGQPWVEKVSFGGYGSGRGEFRGPCGVAVSQDNEVYIADRGNSRIQVFTMDGVYIREFTTGLPGDTDEKLLRSTPWDVAVDRNNNLWVVSKHRVVQYSKEGTRLATKDLPFIDDADIRWFRGITVSMATEQVIVTEYDGQNGQLRVFNQDGYQVGIYGAGHRAPKPWWPRYVTVDGEGNILVTDSNNHCVHVWDRKGNFKFKFGSEGSDQLKNPEGICVDGKGNIIVADKGNHCVKKGSYGRFLSYIVRGMKDPQAVAMSPGGDVVVTDDKTKTVSVWTQG
ncbi:PREDICTED: RING finger protein nhl-1-like [Branchiostoma belcheri]|uniref:RING finger protein nhl-1-like n=1 Tax=Branchiostoma belcheri TaxID=7741 RepID=A0A6P4Y438_BRABE|nr:PREDICTED: RING finger protein nhl-1-like [Branchiostoma belcheri]